MALSRGIGGRFPVVLSVRLSLTGMSRLKRRTRNRVEKRRLADKKTDLTSDWTIRVTGSSASCIPFPLRRVAFSASELFKRMQCNTLRWSACPWLRCSARTGGRAQKGNSSVAS